jgi:trans-2,3-dihydro-3-hydroxyanthranilate isomerase
MLGERRFGFAHVDVFARRPLEGNPLAVFTDARGMTDGEMQSVAREMRLSETTFVLPREIGVERVNGVRTRIFTPQEELPFAGHPTLGTAWVLKNGRMEDEILLDLNVGRVPVRFSQREGRLFGEMVQPEPKWGAVHKPEKVATALGIDPADLDPAVPTETVSTGNPFAIVPFQSIGKLRDLQPSQGQMDGYLRTTDAKFFYLVSRETVNPEARLHARMIFSGGEDPATGSAAGPAAAWMLRHGWIQPEEEVWVEQGVEMARPSQIFVRAGGSREQPRNIRVGGFCFGVIRGELTLPSPR